MAANYSLEELEAELARRGEVSSGETVLAPVEETSLERVKNITEATLKGATRGLVKAVGGWGTLYDILKGSKDPNAFTPEGITKIIKDTLGTNLMQIPPGTKGAYQFAETGAPAAAFTALGVPGLFSRTIPGVAGEFAVGGATGLLGQSVAPESPLAQMAIGMSPYAIKGGFTAGQKVVTAPKGSLSPETGSMLEVGPLTPGEATGSRMQLAREQRIEAAPSIEGKAKEFRQEQAASTESFLTKLFDRASSSAILDPQETANKLTTAFQNYGKALSAKLQSDATADFNKAKKAGGLIDTQPVINATQDALSSIPVETPGFSTLQSNLNKILTEFAIPEVPATRTPSVILNEAGQPARITETAAVPAQSLKISIDRLQKNLSAWGQAAWSGEFNLNGSNIFTGIAPGQAKGIARAVLRGYKNALDDAIDSGVAGAEQLKAARDKFADNLQKIDEFSERPIVKAFGKPTSQLVPERDVIPALRDMPQTQRKILFEIVGQNSPEMADTIRRLQFDDVLGSAVNAAAAKGDPTFVIGKALDALNSKSGDFAFLFDNPADLNKARQAVKYMQTVMQSAGGAEAVGAAGSTLYSGSRAVGATSSVANAVKEVGLLLQDIVARPNAFADVIFNKDTVKSMLDLQKQPTLDKALKTLSNLGKTSAATAVRAVPYAETSSPQEPGTEQGPSLQDLEAELQRRGIQVPME
jgi:hypothetical protein